MHIKFKEIIANNTKLNTLTIANRKLKEENECLMSKVVFLTKQVSNRDFTINCLQELANLGIQEVAYETTL